MTLTSFTEVLEFSAEGIEVSLCPEAPRVIVICGTPAAWAADTAAAIAAAVAAWAACAILPLASARNTSASSLTKN